MRSLAPLALAFALAPAAFANLPADGGGRDVSIAVFSTHTLHGVTIAPLGPNAWTAKCQRCPHAPLTAPLQLEGPLDIFLGGTVLIADDASHEARAATGLWHLRAQSQTTSRKPAMDIVLTMPSERYVAAVLAAEAAPDEPAQSLRALAVLARTYALNGRHFTPQPGHLAADLCDSTQCQAMRLGPVSQGVEDAVRATAGETLWSASHRAEVFFSQNCGGTTEDAAAQWPNLRGVPYVRGRPDPFCERRDRAVWHSEIPLPQLALIAQREGWRLPAHIVTVQIAERSASHRALRLIFTGAGGERASLSASALRFGIGRGLGWNQVRSDLYELGIRSGALIFDGRGHGHGVGLCQTGATEMAAEGKSERDILAFYFPGATVRILPSDDGWQQIQSGAFSLKFTQPLSTERLAELQRSWDEAKRRFLPRRDIAPVIVFSPSTELFRQLTAQPGWALASARGNTIVLQPEAVLRAHREDARSLDVHEMLHVLVEAEAKAEASGRAPLWLREGLVETLAGESSHPLQNLSTAEIDSALLHANSLQQAKRAHLAAASTVRALIDRYGLSTVRGWLTSGVAAEFSPW